MKHLATQHALILGLGDSGLAMARWLLRAGATVRVWDSRAEPPQAAALRVAVPSLDIGHADLRQPEAWEAALQGCQLVLKSPGLSPGDPRIEPLLAQAQVRGIPVWGELDLFAQALAELRETRAYAPKVLAITGTNGKTTTTSLTALLVARCAKRVGLAGNIGPTLLQTLADALDAQALAQAQAISHVMTPEPAGDSAPSEREKSSAAPSSNQCLPEVWVLELSSFQLHGVKSFEPDAAVVLNVSEDHLDWHESMQAYAADKARIFGGRGVMVLNRDDAVVMAMSPSTAAPQEVGLKGKGRIKPPAARSVVSFGLQAPSRVGDFGWVVENGMAWLVRAIAAEDTAGMKKSDIPADLEFILQRLMPADALRIRGRHNAANALAALALTTAIDLPLAPMLHGLREYGGEPHRVQPLARIDEVDYIDDSKGTNVGATVAAIEGLAQDRSPAKLVLILGGDGKGQEFSPLRGQIERHARAVALIGRDASAIAAVLEGLSLPIQTFADLPTATRWARSQAKAFDAVLLSPACASLDMFRNYAHRAEVFAAEVQSLQAEKGELA